MARLHSTHKQQVRAQFIEWKRNAQADMEFRYGQSRRSIRVREDEWKELYALGKTPAEAVNTVMLERGRRW